jgi:glutamyl-tRNA synthetase
MVANFSWDKVSLGGPVFDLDKLTWLNEKYVHDLSYEQLVDALLGWRLSREHLLKVMPLVRERIKRLDEFIPLTEYFFAGDLDYTAIAGELTVPDVAPAGVAQGLLTFVDKIEARQGWDAKMLEEEGRAWATELGWKTKHAFMLLRLVVTARKASPGLFDTMAVLGKEVTRRRLRQAAELLARRA